MLDQFGLMKILSTIIALSYLVCYLQAEDVPLQLPHCNLSKTKGSSLNNYVMVSTLDGRLTAFNLENGTKAWVVETPPLLSSNLASSEFSGENRVKLVPSLRGSLYTVHGSKIKRLPFNIHQLLSESFTESNNLITAGGHDILRIGIDTKTGRIIYKCNSNGCNNEQQTTETGGDVLVLTRQATAIRGLDPRTGIEKWNFSTAAHELQISRGECIGDRIVTESPVNMHVSMHNQLVTVLSGDLNKPLWEHKLDAPITDVWELYDGNLRNSLWQDSRSSNIMGQMLYVGDHQEQLYILDEFDHSQKDRSLMVVPYQSRKRFIILDKENVYLPLSDKSTYIPFHEAEDSNATEVSDKVKKVRSWLFDILTCFTLALALVLLIFPFYARIRVMIMNVPQTTVNVVFNEDIPSEKELEAKRPSNPEYPGRYEKDFTTVRRLGRGGFGVVFEARNNIDNCSYAVKRITLPRKKERHERVLREARALANLEHPHIVRYFNAWVQPCLASRRSSDCEANSISTTCNTISPKDASVELKSTASDNSSFVVFARSEGEAPPDGATGAAPERNDSTDKTRASSKRESKDDLASSMRKSQGDVTSSTEQTDCGLRLELYIQMQLCDPNSLYDWLRNNRDCPDRYQRAKVIFSQIVSAVEYVHLEGLIHRDLKPSNIMFAPNGQVKVADFGLVAYMHDAPALCGAARTPRAHPQLTHRVGTEVYMSPEQLQRRPYSYKVDIYSLGLILLELLQPFGTEAERAACLTRVRDQVYPDSFEDKYPKETAVLKLMLNPDPLLRPTASGVRARAPLFEATDEKYHFELPPRN